MERLQLQRPSLDDPGPQHTAPIEVGNFVVAPHGQDLILTTLDGGYVTGKLRLTQRIVWRLLAHLREALTEQRIREERAAAQSSPGRR